MAKANPFDPAASVVDTLYCTPTDDDRAFIYPYPGTTLSELNPNGTICQPGTLLTAPTTW